jgi:hypothetical protein
MAKETDSPNQQSIINNTTYNAPVVQGGDYVNGDKIIHNHPPEPAPDTRADTILLDKSEIMDALITNQKITKKKEKLVSGNRIIDAEYWIKTTFDDVFCYLQKKYPSLEVEEFMRRNLKGKRGGSLGNSFRVKRALNRH